jgi:hypothetical protein
MSMSTHVVGFAPPDETWLKMKSVWDACEAAGVTVPENVSKFFNYERPDAAGVCIELDHYKTPHECLKKYRADSQEGFEIDISKLPPQIKTIRFFNSY